MLKNVKKNIENLWKGMKLRKQNSQITLQITDDFLPTTRTRTDVPEMNPVDQYCIYLTL